MNGCDNDTGSEHVAGGCMIAVVIGLFFWAGVIIIAAEILS